ncbi:HAD hydrolase-like protein [Burkholderia multivorans]|nr:HAD hydrolase-like protein [Burkholderia multivorans]MCL4630129.1 HAD hydrolase-like protein [Burkholderia multivorans]
MDSTAHNRAQHPGRMPRSRSAEPSDESARYVIGLGLRDALRITAPTLDPSDYPRLAERYRYHYLLDDQRIELFAGVRELLAELRDLGYLLAVATGKGRVGLNRVLDQSKLTRPVRRAALRGRNVLEAASGDAARAVPRTGGRIWRAP